MAEIGMSESVFVLSSALSPMYRAGTFPACHSARPANCSVHCLHSTQCSDVSCFVLFSKQMAVREFAFDIDRCVSSRCLSLWHRRLQPRSGAELRSSLSLHSKQCQFLTDVSEQLIGPLL